MMTQNWRQLRRDERGAALAIVMLVGTVLIVLSSVMIARGMRQLVNTNNDTNWDSALFAAESGLDAGLSILDMDFEYTTGEAISPGLLGTDAERDWAVAAADARDAGDLVTVPEGEYVFIRPSGSTVLFSVGYSPSRDAIDRRVRVVRASVDGVPWTFTIEHAVLVGGNLELGGNMTVNDTNGNSAASVHANGGMVFTGNSWVVEGCTTSSESTISGSAQCPPSPAALEPVPVVDPLVLYHFAHYVLCDDEAAYGGPAHPTTPDPDLVPCDGDETLVALDWIASTQGGAVEWDGSGSEISGVFYIDNGNYRGKLGDNNTILEATVITAASNATCLGPASGSIELSANSNVVRHSSLAAAGFELVLIAQGDIAFGGAATIGGAILANEQVDYHGNADSWGPVVAADACDTPGSPIGAGNSIVASTVTSSSTVNYPGPVTTPFFASTLHAEVVGWYEL